MLVEFHMGLPGLSWSHRLVLFDRNIGPVGQIKVGPRLAFSWTGFSHALRSRRSECREVVRDCDPDPQFRHLHVEVACHEPFAEQH